MVTALVDADPRVRARRRLRRGAPGRPRLPRPRPAAHGVLGSVSASVARHAHCPVVVCRPPASPARPATGVVVGADGTAASRPGPRVRLRQASLRGRPLTVMHCFWDVLARPAAPSGRPRRAGRPRRPAAAAGRVRRRVAPRSTPTSSHPASWPAAWSTSASPTRPPTPGCVVVGRSAAAGWSRFLHASCALAVLERAHTTVAVVPEPDDPSRRGSTDEHTTNAVVVGDRRRRLRRRPASSPSPRPGAPAARCTWSTSCSCRPARPTPASTAARSTSPRPTLDDAMARAEELAGSDVPVTAELVDNGWVVDDLVRRTEGASLLVHAAPRPEPASSGSSRAPWSTASPAAPTRR